MAVGAPAVSKWRWYHTVALFALAIAIVGAPFVLVGLPRVSLWILAAVLMLLLIVSVGHGKTGLLRGFLIDELDRMSLGRLQLVAWTVLAISAYLVMALSNIRQGDPNPLVIAIPEEIWILLGISTGSLVGSGMIKANKGSDDPGDTWKAAAAVKRNLRTLGTQIEDGASKDVRKLALDRAGLREQGQLMGHTDPTKSSWGDLFSGEEKGNFAYVDIAKVQMFFFTLAIVLAYSVSVAGAFASSELVLKAFPDLSEGTVALLGISHAGYVSSKAAPHTPK